MSGSASVLSAAVLAIAGFAGPGSAATITPNPTSFVLNGTLSLRQMSGVNCKVTLNGVVPTGGGAASIVSGTFAPATPSDWPCGSLVVPTGFPWAVTLNGGTSITIMGVGSSTIAGNCSGAITTNWINGSPGKVTFVSATLPGTPGPCFISGTLNSAPSLTVM